MASMFELLMELPLFKGVTHERIAQIVGDSKFHFLKFPAGETIVRAGDQCAHLTFVISGSVRSTIVNANNRFSVSQTLVAPAVLAPDFLFGRVTNFPCTVQALEPTGVMEISKADYLNILSSDKVFMFNYLNTLAANGQKAMQGILSLTTGDIDERIAFWIGALTQPGGSDIRLTCRKRDLCSLFGVQRTVFESRLISMKERGLIDYTANELVVVDRRALMALLMHNCEGDSTNA